MTESRRPLSRKLRHWLPLPIALFAVVGSMLRVFEVDTGWEAMGRWTDAALAVTIAAITMNVVIDQRDEERAAGAD